MKKWLIGASIGFAAIAAFLCFTRIGTVDCMPLQENLGADGIKTGEAPATAASECSTAVEVNAESDLRGSDGTSAFITVADADGSIVDKNNFSIKGNSGQDATAISASNVKPESGEVKTNRMESNWPSPSKSRFAGKTIDYRSVELPPNEKGGKPGELREWIIEPEEGYTAHVEEEYRPDENGEMQLVNMNQYAANQVLLTLDGDVSFEAFKAQMKQKGAVAKAPLMELDKGAKIVAVMLPKVAFDSVDILREAVASYDSNLNVECDRIKTIERTPNDGRYSSQWGLPKIGAPEAWNIRTDASSVVVAVLDTGVNYNHPDLAANMWVKNSSLSAANYRHGVKSVGGVVSGNPMDDVGHGSHCAGIIGAVGNNSTGVSGVAWNVKIMALKFFDSDGNCTESDEIFAMNWGRTNGAHIVSMSFGGYGRSSVEENAISQLRSSGIIAVCAAGNDAVDTDSRAHTPSAYSLDNIVSVAASTSSDTLASFSNYGASSVDIVAPGVDILSTVGVARYGQYESWPGTSMATPFVAGSLALLKAHYPSYTYLQLIQKLYAGGDSLSAFSGKCTTGKRLNVYKALSTAQLVSPVPAASRGTYSDRVYVSWPSVSGATYYRVYRATSSTGSKTALGSWQTGTSYSDSGVASGTTYYYWVCAATSSSGANQSAYGSYATGYAQPSSGDSWDPGDDTPSGGTLITPSTSRSTHGSHTLSGTDKYDFFKISMTAGTRYIFETTGSMDTYGELFNSTSTNESNRVIYNDDGGTNNNFRIEYTPSSSGTYYLRVRAWALGSSGSYSLVYQRSGVRDSWDPGDDTPSGGTSLTPTTTVQTHGTHTLSADDHYDFFRIAMTAGRKYVFESTGSYDMYGELFNSTSTNASYRVAYNDDGGESFNFKIEYTPTVSQMYYLRVKRYFVGSDGSYSLKYSYEQSASHDIGFCNYLGWPAPFVITSSTNTMAQTTSFTTNQTIWVCYQGEEVNDLELAGPITNCCKIVNNATGATRFTLQVIYGQLSSGRIMLDQTEIRGLEAGSYTATMELNKDKNGNRKIVESTYTNNTRAISFTITNPQKTLSSIAISGNVNIPSKGTADYRCIGTYSDGSTADVSPVWSISSGASYASVSPSGRVTANETTVDRSIALRAEFGGKSAAKAITVVRENPGSDPDPLDPDPWNDFGEIVSYPRAPMIVEGVMYINDVPAAVHDEVAAFAGNELRGKAGIQADGRFTLGVNVAEVGETITFKFWDASAGDHGTIYPCLQSLAGSSDPQGTASSPLRFDAGVDPFGPVTPEPLVPPTIIQASVTIDGEAASAGDVLAVFSGGAILAKVPVNYANQNGRASATCIPVMFFSGTKTLSFKLWDADADSILEAAATLTMTSGDVRGTVSNPYAIAFSSEPPPVPCPVSLKAGWNLVSFSVLPESPTPANVFAQVASSVQYVSDVSGNLWGPAIGNNGLNSIRLGAGYWVRSTANNVNWEVEGRGDPETEISLSQGWNLVGYTLPRAGLVADVLRTALASGRIQYITDQAGNVYPGGSLTSLRPGVGYWLRATGGYAMKYDISGMATASDLLSIMSADGSGVHPFGTPVVRVGVPTVFDGVSVSVFGKPAAYGDYLAVFDRNTDELLAVQKVNTEDGTLMFTIMGLARNDKLYFKVWNSASGLDSPEIFSAPQSNDLTISSPDNPVVGFGVAITGTKPTYTVRYDLAGKATRTGGGSLTQNVAFGADAADPTISVNAGWRFVDWDYSKRTDIRRSMTITALYEADDTPPPTYAVTYKPGTNGTGVQQTATKTQDVALTLADAIFTRTGYTQTGWATSDGGAKAYNLSASYTANAATALYPFWTANTYTIAFDANGGTGTMSNMAMTYDVARNLASNAFAKNGSTFAGWATSAGGSVVYANGTSVKNLTSTQGATVTLYAKWTAAPGPDDPDMPYPLSPAQGLTIVNGVVTAWDGTGPVDMVIPEGVREIGEYVFHRAWWERGVHVRSVKLPDSVETLGEGAFVGSHLEAISFGTGLRTIGHSAFANTHLSGTIRLPEGVASIGKQSFMGSRITHIYLPATIRSVARASFESCAYLQGVHFAGNAPSLDLSLNDSFVSTSTSLFRDGNESATVYVVRGTAGWEYGNSGGMAIWPKDDSHARNVRYESGEVIRVCTVTFDPNGGKPAKQTTLIQPVGAEWDAERLPQPLRSGFVFDGWYTAKTGGERVETSDICGLTQKTTLYAHWLKAYKVAVKDGTVSDGVSEPAAGISALGGTDLVVEAADKSGKNMVFSHWTCKPYADLGEYFNPRDEIACITMPEKAITLTANYITNPAYVSFEAFEQNDTGNDDGTPEGIQWSMDGQTWTDVDPAETYPVKSGKTAIKFRSSDLRWTVPASVTYNLAAGAEEIISVAATRVSVVFAVSSPDDGAAGTVSTSPSNGQVMPGKTVSLSSKAGRGSVFAYWILLDYEEGLDGELSIVYAASAKVSPVRDTIAVAVFKLVDTVAEPELLPENIGLSANSMVGVAFSMDMELPLSSRPAKFSAKGLPAGLKIDPSSGVIAGVPSKAGTYTVSVTATSGANPKMATTVTVNLEIAPLPLWAQGSFSGYVFADSGEFEAGAATMSVSAAGKISGKVSILGTNWTVSAACYSAESYTAEPGEEWLLVEAEMKAGKIAKKMLLAVEPAMQPETYAHHPECTVPLLGADVNGVSSDGSFQISMSRNVWKDKSTAETAKAVLSDWEGVYTAQIWSEDQDEYGHGYLSVTIDKNGNVKATGKLADGTSVSMTSPLMFSYQIDAETGEGEESFFAPLFMAPAAYKGGFFLLELQFEERGGYGSTEDSFAFWRNRNPAATGVYGAGFERMPEIYAHYYDKLEKLERYCSTLRFTPGPAAPMLEYQYSETDYNEAGRKATTTYGAIVEAVDLSEQIGTIVTVDGKGTAFLVAKPTKPVQDKETKEWLYDGENDGSLTVSFTQATGIFKGSYTFWYDYESAYNAITGKSTMSHTPKTVKFEGILVPGLICPMAGFYLWDSSGEDLNGKAYKYKESFPVFFFDAAD